MCTVVDHHCTAPEENQTTASRQISQTFRCSHLHRRRCNNPPPPPATPIPSSLSLLRIPQPQHHRHHTAQSEYGEVDIDGSLVAAKATVAEDIIMLNNGCLCCTVRGDLVRMIAELVNKKKGNFKHIVIETTATDLVIAAAAAEVGATNVFSSISQPADFSHPDPLPPSADLIPRNIYFSVSLFHPSLSPCFKILSSLRSLNPPPPAALSSPLHFPHVQYVLRDSSSISSISARFKLNIVNCTLIDDADEHDDGDDDEEG
ncbi:hypothetical protein Droror1_Dr00021468 [Drosera rotundifolia]